MRRIFENGAIIFLIVVVVGGFAYSLYSSVFSTTAEQQDETRQDLISACQRNLSRSIIFQDFAREAAAARRRSAENYHKNGNTVAAANEIATAQKYEDFASHYDRLTIHNCEEYYGN